MGHVEIGGCEEPAGVGGDSRVIRRTVTSPGRGSLLDAMLRPDNILEAGRPAYCGPGGFETVASPFNLCRNSNLMEYISIDKLAAAQVPAFQHVF